MTTPAYHVGQILYHRASGERAIVVEVRPGVVQVSADVNRFVEFHLDGMPLVFSTEPVVVDEYTKMLQADLAGYARDTHLLKSEIANLKQQLDYASKAHQSLLLENESLERRLDACSETSE